MDDPLTGGGIASALLRPQWSGLAVVVGDAHAHTLVTLLGVGAAGPRPVVVLDGANAFDAFLLADAARVAGADPQALLRRVLVSRAFTCHQLARLVTEGLPDALARHEPAAVIGLGLDATFYDEQVPGREARRLWRRLTDGIGAAARSGPTLVSCGPIAVPERADLVRALWKTAGWRFHLTLTPQDGAVLITRRHPAPGRWRWSPDAAPTPRLWPWR